MRQVMSTALVALVVGGLAGATVSALAQSEPEAVTPAAVSDINAHRVDGKHAVGAGATRAQRTGKLVATNSQGYLPSNILYPRPVTRTSFALPTEVYAVEPNNVGSGYASCPFGYKVTGGGFFQSDYGLLIAGSRPVGSTSWRVDWNNPNDRTTDTMRVYAVCIATTPRSAIPHAPKPARTTKAD